MTILQLAVFYFALKFSICSDVCPVIYSGRVSYFGIGEKGSNSLTYYGYDLKKDKPKNFCAIMFEHKDREKYRDKKIMIYNKKNNKVGICKIIDRGPSKFTGRSIDLSYDIFKELELKTDDTVRFTILENKN